MPDACLASPTLEESEANWRQALSAGGLGKGKFLIVAQHEANGLVGYVLAGGRSELADSDREFNVLMVDPPWR